MYLTVKAEEVKIGDRRVWLQGMSSEVVKLEMVGKASIRITCKWFNKMLRVENGKWISGWTEDTRTLRRSTAVEIERLQAGETFKSIPRDEMQEAQRVEREKQAPAPKTSVGAKKGQTAFEKWFDVFLEEKEINLDYLLQTTYKGFSHIMFLREFVDIIKKAPAHEQRQIKEKFVYIDFKNGDTMHFIKYLFESYVKVNEDRFVS